MTELVPVGFLATILLRLTLTTASASAGGALMADTASLRPTKRDGPVQETTFMEVYYDLHQN